MTSEEANKINLDSEIDIDKLRSLAKYWQERAYKLAVELKLNEKK